MIQSQFNAGAGACSDIPDKTRPVVEQDLSSGCQSSVDPDVRDALVNSFDHLFDLVTSQCQNNTNTDTNTTPTDTNTTPTDTNTTPTDTNTTPTDTNTTPTNPPGQQKKPKKQKGNGNGNGGGNGGGPAAPGTGG